MNDLKKDTARMSELMVGAARQAGVLAALAEGSQLSPEKLQKELELASARFEHTAVEMRKLCEKNCPGVGGYGDGPELPRMETAGFVEQFGYGWLHIQLNTLLPHCRYRPSEWLSDTIRRLLDEYESGGSKLPYFKHAMLVIDEHCGIKGRTSLTRTIRGGRSFPMQSRAGSSPTMTSTPWPWRCCPARARSTSATLLCWISRTLPISLLTALATTLLRTSTGAAGGRQMLL